MSTLVGIGSEGEIMVKIIRTGPKVDNPEYTVPCARCGSILSYNTFDEAISETRLFNKSYYIICPVCQNTVTTKDDYVKRIHK